MDPYVGEIRLFAGSFAPRGWAFCDGSLLQIQQQPVLFSIIGIVYGGDGKTTFQLPNLIGSVALGAGQGTGLTYRPLGSRAGRETVTLSYGDMPSHTHAVACGPSAALKDPSGNVWGDTPRGAPSNYTKSAPNVPMAPTALSAVVGGDRPHDNLQPYLALNYIIALEGIFPARPR